MYKEYYLKAEALRESGTAFATATVVRDLPPSSGKPGDKALIERDGSLHGWIGGGCTKSIIVKEAMESLQDGKSRLVRISPKAPEQEEAGILHYPMTCYSGGTVEVFIEPILPQPHVIILGKSSVARSLSTLGKAMGYTITALAPDANVDIFPEADQLSEDFDLSGISFNSQTFVVVSSQGELDEAALEAATASPAKYVAFVGSRKKANAVFGYLRSKGVPFSRLAEVKSPAGLDIKARKPAEIALSILAEIVERIRTYAVEDDQDAMPAVSGDAPPKHYINPVCGVPVEIKTAKHTIEYKGEKVYFCCDGCKISFEADPEKYVKA